MINTITVINPSRERLVLDLSNPWETGLAIKSITGLTPGSSTINITEVSSTDGGIYNSSRQSTRNVVFDFALIQTPTETIEQIRHKCYRFFPIKKKVTVIVDTDDRSVRLEGYVETNEPNIFSKLETINVSILCADPYLYFSGDNQVTQFDGIDPNFEFPFESDNNSEGMTMGFVEIQTKHNIPYTGDVDCGLIFTLNIIGDVENPKIIRNDTGDYIGIDTTKLQKLTGSSLKAGDIVEISTARGQKYIKLIRGEKVINIINCLMAGSKWLTLIHGDNVVRYEATYGPEKIHFKLENQIIYEGI